MPRHRVGQSWLAGGPEGHLQGQAVMVMTCLCVEQQRPPSLSSEAECRINHRSQVLFPASWGLDVTALETRIAVRNREWLGQDLQVVFVPKALATICKDGANHWHPPATCADKTFLLLRCSRRVANGLGRLCRHTPSSVTATLQAN